MALLEELQESTYEVQQSITALNDKIINQRPSWGGWSPGEILEHVISTEIYFDNILNGLVASIERGHDEKVIAIDDKFLNFDVAFRKGKNIPAEVPFYEKSDLAERFSAYRTKLTDFVVKEDLTLLCEDFSHGLFGTLTRYEWVHFHVIHAKRHMFQLEKTVKDLV